MEESRQAGLLGIQGEEAEQDDHEEKMMLSAGLRLR